MAQNFTKTTTVAENLGDGGAAIAKRFHGYGQRKGLRGMFALGFLVLASALSYGTVFVLIDMWYKGGSLGIF